MFEFFYSQWAFKKVSITKQTKKTFDERPDSL